MALGEPAGVGRVVVGRVGLVLWLALLAGACSSDDGVGPRIDSLAPAEAGAGDTVEILGTRFCGDAAGRADEMGRCLEPPAGFVNLGGDAQVVRAQVSAWADDRIGFVVPDSAPRGVTFVVVMVNGVASNPVEFEVQ